MRCTQLVLMPFSFAINGSGTVGRLGGRIAQRQGDNTLGHLSFERRNARGSRLVAQQALEPPSMKRCCQRQTLVFDLALGRDLVGAEPLSRQQHDLGSPDVLLRSVAVPDEGLEAAGARPARR
jgi:hypothetical protein